MRGIVKRKEKRLEIIGVVIVWGVRLIILTNELYSFFERKV